MTTQPNMLKAALWYAKRGYHVFPLHNAIFDEAGNCTGCTCEEWKRTQPEYGPDFKCEQPGKCPRVKWSTASTIDEATIRKWWAKPWRNVDVETGRVIWSYPNIGIDAGKSGRLFFDKDLYKKTYAGDALPIDDLTVMSKTGGGGIHEWYEMPSGKAYGNATGTLPSGIDVRGVGGYIVAPPSLHKSGRRYTFVEGHSPLDLAPQPLPQFLIDILEAAQASRGAANVHFSEHVGDAPNLAQWSLVDDTLDLIHYGAPKGSDRSKADYHVCIALATAGATDDEIRAVFAHYPIGEKYREKGRDGDKYLALTIGKARAKLEEPADESSKAAALLRDLRRLRTWVQGPELTEMLREHEVARPADYIKTLIAIINHAIVHKSLRVRLGSRQLGEMTNSSHMTAKRHLAMFGEGITIKHEKGAKKGTVTHRPGLNLVIITGDPEGYGKWIDLTNLLQTVTLSTLSNIYPSVEGCNTSQQFANNHLQDEAFVLYPRHFAVKMRPNDDILPYGLSSAALLIAAVLCEHGELTRAAICTLTGLSTYTAGKMLRRMDELGLLVVWQGKPYRYDLHPNFEEMLDDVRPLLPSAGITKRRGYVSTEARILYTKRRLNGPEPLDRAEVTKLERRLARYERAKQALIDTAAESGMDVTVKLMPAPPIPPDEQAHMDHLDRLRTLVITGERAQHRPKRSRYKPKRPNVSIFAADAEWHALNAWAQMEYGSGWWVHRDVNGILGAYERYLEAAEHIPTMHWDGPGMAVAA